MDLIRPLEQLTLEDRSQYGGKAAHLGEAARLGCPVLGGYVLGTELYHRFMRQGGLQGEVSSILSSMQPQTLTQFQAAEWAIRSAFEMRRLPRDVQETIERAWELVGAEELAVRSSATNEDSPDKSFVGQHGSFLSVQGKEELVKAVIGCWQSLFSAKALAYAQSFGVDLPSASMAVILQPMLHPESEGALFSVDPVTGDPNVFILEVSEGDRTDVHRLDPYERAPGERPFWSQLRTAGLVLDEHEQRYQTLEWALADGELYVLRVRPATGVPTYLPVSASDLGAGAARLYLQHEPDETPREVRPCSWYHRSRSRQLHADYFRQINKLLSRHTDRQEYYLRGYAYARWYSHSLFDWDRMRGLQHLSQSTRRLLASRGLADSVRATLARLRPRLQTLCERDLSQLSDDELARHLQDTIDLGGALWQQRGRLGDSGEALGDVARWLAQAWLGEPARLAPLLEAIDTPTSRRDLDLFEIAQGPDDEGEALEDRLSRHFWRFRHLYLESQGDSRPDWRDVMALTPDRELAERQLARYRREEQTSPERELARKREGQHAAERSLRQDLGRAQASLLVLLARQARTCAGAIAECQADMQRCRFLERETVLEAGRRLRAKGLAGDDRDGALLGCREIPDWLHGQMEHEAVVRLVQKRKDLYRRWSRYSPPETIGGSPTADEPAFEMGELDTVLRGRPICAGHARGTARVVTSVAEAQNVVPGEILVCTEPLFEYSAVFDIVRAVVTERGGLLEHGSVLVREYGLPAVFGVQGVTQRIHTGDRVWVDGGGGIVVRRIEEPTFTL